LRNALTGRSGDSEGGVDQPKDLPEEELDDFMLKYDKTDPFCYKVVKKMVECSDSDDDLPPMGDIEGNE
jgi:hypothetical protein